MSAAFDLLVVGAGPGGLAAAVTAAECGLRVCLVDDNPSAGGQIWRRSISRPGPGTRAAAWFRRLRASRIETRFGWRAVLAPAARVLRIENGETFADIAYTSLLLAAGARELFLPFPGWTLPGVYGVGGLQAFVKSGFDVRGKRIVIAGSGPLLLAVAAHLRAAGARIAFIAEQAPLARLARFSLELLRGQQAKLIEGAAYAFRTAGVPYRTGSWVTAALGRDRVEKVLVRTGSHTREIAADMLAVGYHLVPNTELAQLLHCELDHGYVRVDELQRASAEAIYCVGESTGIGGLDKALVEGRIAALALAGRTEQARRLFAFRDRQSGFARELAAAFALRDELRALPAADTVFCRCEDVPYAAVSGCHSSRAAKLFTRCGMGPCQGRICGAAAAFLLGWPLPAPRPPLSPIAVEALAGAPAETPSPVA